MGGGRALKMPPNAFVWRALPSLSTLSNSPFLLSSSVSVPFTNPLHMDDQTTEPTNGPLTGGGGERTEPVRSRWTPKPEQILILESIFNSGMVNPPKDETVRIRKLLEKFGSVGDANVFYWFQNRRSRSRRRQRQLQAGMAAMGLATGAIQYDPTTSSSAACVASTSSSSVPSPPFSSSSSSCFFPSSSYSSGGFVEDSNNELFSMSQQMGMGELEQTPSVSSTYWPSNTANFHYQSGLIMVFINGVPHEVPRGSFDLRAMFGPDVILVHSSGEPVPVNEYGISLQSLKSGENYFSVSRIT